MSTSVLTPELGAMWGTAPESKKIVEVASSYVPRLRVMQAETDRAARIPEELAEDMEAAGLFSLSKPKEFGGLQTDLGTWLEVVSQLGRGNGGVAWATTLLNACHWSFVALFPKPIIEEVYSKPHTRLSGVFSFREMKARNAPGGLFIERGVWMFNTGVHLAHWDLLGVPLLNEAGEQVARGIAVVPMSDITILNDWDTIGLRASGSSSVSVENVFIPNERIVPLKDAVDGNYKGGMQDQALYRAAFMPLTAIVLSFPTLGLGMHMLEEILAKMPTRNIPYTAYTKSGEAPVTHLQLGEAAAKIESSRLMLAGGCAEIQSWAEKGETMPYMDRARMRLYTGNSDRMIWEAVDLLASAGGGSFARSSNLLNRIWQDARVTNMHGIAAPASNFELYGRLLCGMDSNMMNV